MHTHTPHTRAHTHTTTMPSPVVDGGMPPRSTKGRRGVATKARVAAITHSTTAYRRGIRTKTVLGEGSGSVVFRLDSPLRTAIERLGVGLVDTTAGIIVDDPGLVVGKSVSKSIFMG